MSYRIKSALGMIAAAAIVSARFRERANAGLRYDPHRLSEIVDADGDPQDQRRTREGAGAARRSRSPGMNSPAACRCWRRSTPATSISAPTSPIPCRCSRRPPAPSSPISRKKPPRLRRRRSWWRGIADPDGRRPQGQEGCRHQGRRQSFPAACCARQVGAELQGHLAGLPDAGGRPRGLHRRQCRRVGGVGSVPHQRAAPVQCAGIVRRQQRPCELQALLSVVGGVCRPAQRRPERDLRQARRDRKMGQGASEGSRDACSPASGASMPPRWRKPTAIAPTRSAS